MGRCVVVRILDSSDAEGRTYFRKGAYLCAFYSNGRRNMCTRSSGNGLHQERTCSLLYSVTVWEPYTREGGLIRSVTRDALSSMFFRDRSMRSSKSSRPPQ